MNVPRNNTHESRRSRNIIFEPRGDRVTRVRLTTTRYPCPRLFLAVGVKKFADDLFRPRFDRRQNNIVANWRRESISLTTQMRGQRKENIETRRKTRRGIRSRGAIKSFVLCGPRVFKETRRIQIGTIVDLPRIVAESTYYARRLKV